MKYAILISLFIAFGLHAASQTPLVRSIPGKYFKYDPGKYFDKKEYKLFAPAKNYGTFFLSGIPLQTTNLLLNINGKFSLLNLKEILNSTVTTSIKRKAFILSDTFPQANLLYNTDKGNIYALPLDNMKCLMPDEIYTLNERQHYQQTYPLNSISNPYPKNNIIPLEGKNSDIKIYPPLPNNKK